MIDFIKNYLLKRKFNKFIKNLESQLNRNKVPTEYDNITGTIYEYSRYNYSALNPIYFVQLGIIKTYGNLWDKLRITGINVERVGKDKIKIILSTERPGLIIGKGGRDMNNLNKELNNLFGSCVSLDIKEVSPLINIYSL